MKTTEELNKLKEEIQEINQKLKELTPEELQEVAGGLILPGNVKRLEVPREWLDDCAVQWWDV